MRDNSNKKGCIEGINYVGGTRVVVCFENGIITSVRDAGLKQNDDIWLAPGLIDNQVNGYVNVNFSNPGITTDQFDKLVIEMSGDGITAFVPTVITDSDNNLKSAFRNLAKLVNESQYGEMVPGFHLEGPYLSKSEGYYGCHPYQYLRDPSWDEFSSYQEAALGRIMEITIAPETKGAIHFIERCISEGIKVSIGHTAADAQQIWAAIDAGAVMSTHLGNGCANMIDRHKNPIWPQLADDRLCASIIADGHHLLPEELKVFTRSKGTSNIILISDATHLIGLPPGDYSLMGQVVRKTEAGLVTVPGLNCLAGASFPLLSGVNNMVKLTGLSYEEALNMASSNVARVLGLNNRGVLEAGRRADLIQFKIDGQGISIQATWVGGKKVFSKSV
ncbi:MAG: N-acetylglucosamine-6-phosphate deacetylase [Bacteroidales bacterium]